MRLRAFKIVQQFPLKQKTVVRILPPIQGACPFASLEIRTQIFESLVEWWKKLCTNLKH